LGEQASTPSLEKAAAALLSSIRTIPSAPASHRICWPPARHCRTKALAGSGIPPDTAGGELHPAL